ncbi:putative HhH-GPD base excision DNA repair family protein [Hibiscus syriacus]|uniref:HhH-GPD base excision DNA repair family protein n=1 Tax=Hibiscus syriacus TaxID=106335 RepID=A0A6A2XE84_HIBSY|nr:putative HhH-GPD base excision DNA repair family protein [Hibiscus syriacus]
MASLYCDNQERGSCFTNARYGRSCSKAQACLKKILHLISSVPPSCENNTNPCKKRGFDIDLNLTLGSFLDGGDESEEKSDCVAENSFIEDKTATATATDASSDVTNVQKSKELKSSSHGEVKTATSETAALYDSLGLLLEAAEMIAYGDFCMNGKEKEVEEAEKSGCGMSMERDKDRSVNVKEDGFEEIEDMAPPVVRSKRGRNQVLPVRYRDSVLEPWTKRPKISTATPAAAVVSKKKRKPR